MEREEKLSSLIGGVTAFLGFWFAYEQDWSIGPTEVVLLGLVYALGLVMKKIFMR